MELLRALTPRERHRQLVTHFLGAGPSSSEGLKDDVGTLTTDDKAALHGSHRFLRTEKDDSSNTWEVRLAKKYYERLFREYCIVDLSLYKYGCIGMRWRTESEVLEGKGQFQCGAKQCSHDHQHLSTYEVNFVYMEAGERRQTLVKVRVCPECVEKMNYRRDKMRTKIRRLSGEPTKKKRKREGKDHKKQRERKGSGDKEKSRKEKTKHSDPEDAEDAEDNCDDWMDECLEDMFL